MRLCPAVAAGSQRRHSGYRPPRRRVEPRQQWPPAKTDV